MNYALALEYIHKALDLIEHVDDALLGDGCPACEAFDALCEAGSLLEFAMGGIK